MIKTTREQLGEAYTRAHLELMRLDPITPRILGALWREHFGLHHKHSKTLWTQNIDFWIEFPDDRDYTAFMLRFS